MGPQVVHLVPLLRVDGVQGVEALLDTAVAYGLVVRVAIGYPAQAFHALAGHDLVTVREVVGDDASHRFDHLLTHEEVGTVEPLQAPEERTPAVEPLQRMLPVRLITVARLLGNELLAHRLEVDGMEAADILR